MVRGPAVVLAVVTILLLLPGAAVSTPAHPEAPSASPRSTGVPATERPWTAPDVEPLRGILQHNLTVPEVGPGASVPVSAYQETPPPAVPATTPTVVTVAANAKGCCQYVNRTPSGGPWDSVVLNYTGTAVGSVYDSSYRAYVGGAQVLFGTTPEYGTWTVLDNVTEYESLLEPGANFSFILSAATLGGYFETSVTISFYPAPAGAPVPSEPTEVLPLWSQQFVKPTSPSVTANASVPVNASAVTLELWAYGFQADEFWWAGASPARAVDITLDGSPFAAVYPFPYVNTGGVDLFLWRPIPAAYTLSDRPYDVNLTGALGALEGAHTYAASIDDREASSDWLVEGSLLVWTDPTVGGATLTANAATLPSPSTSGTTESSSTSFRYASTLATTAGPVNVSTSVTGSFRETEASTTAPTNGTSWENLTQSSSMTDLTNASGPTGTRYANSTRNFAIDTDLGSQFLVSTTTGGGYPVTGNGTTSMLDLEQQWTELTTFAATGTTGPVVPTADAVDNEVTGGNGIWTAAESIASAGASPSILSVGFVQSATPKYTTETVSGPGGLSGFTHLMVGSVYEPANVYGAETILENLYDSTPPPLLGAVTPTPDPIDVGETLTLTAVAHGGAGVYAYSWTGLPAGCSPVPSDVVTCHPSAPGVSLPVAKVRDSFGDVATSSPVVVVVAPALNVSVLASLPAVDSGGTLSFSAAISGGTPPYSCTWTLPGTFPTPGSCAGSVPAVTSTTSATVSAEVSVADATGAVVNSTSLAIPIHDPLVLTLAAANATAVKVGVPAEFSVSILGGTAPVVLTWYEGSTVLTGFNGSSVTITPTAPGNLTLSVEAVDAAGGTTTSNVLTVPVLAATGSGGGTPSGATSSPSEYGATFWAAVGLAALAGFEAVLLIGLRRPPRPRTPAPPPPPYEET
jgi:hypothetical protein